MTDLEKVIEEEFGEGKITPKGWINSKGEIVERAKREARMGLSVEDELVIDQWNKQMQRDFPTVDIGMIDMISTYCYLHPDEAREYMIQRTTGVQKDNGKNDFESLDKQYEREF